MKSILENSGFRVSWDFFIVVLILLSCLLIPFEIAFEHWASGGKTVLLHAIDLIFFVDIFLNFITSYRSHGTEVTDVKKTASQYLKTFFAVDLLANLPLDTFFWATPGLEVFGVSMVQIIRANRLLRLVRLFAIFRRWQFQRWTKPGYLRILKFLAVVMVLIHLGACAWFFAAYVDHFPRDCWVVRAGIESAPVGVQYVRSLYWTIATMTTVGYGDIIPGRSIEYIMAIVVMLLGASVYAYIIGNIASLVSNLDSAKVRHLNRIEAVMQYLRHRDVPAMLRARIRNYYEYLWDRRRGLRDERFFDDFPSPLRLEILLHLTRDLLERVPLFRYCSPPLRNVLLMALKPQTYSPDVYIAREGERGKEIYFISQGKVEISSDEGRKIHGTMGDGEYFGALSMLFQEKRTASARALTYCEIFRLSYEDFLQIKGEYPEFKEVLAKIASEKSDQVSSLFMDGTML